MTTLKTIRVVLTRHCVVLGSVVSLLLAISPPGWAQEASDPNQACYDCHAEASMFEGLKDAQKLVIDKAVFGSSVHGSFGCADCHQDLAGVTDFPHAEELAPVNCATCHEQVQTQFETSLHFYAKERGNNRAPGCASCHGAHDILPAADPKAKSHKTNIPAMCASCHGQAGLLTDQLVRLEMTAGSYAESVHGRASRRGVETAAVCTDCHGVHDLKGPADPSSSVNPQNVSKTCGTCHTEEQRAYDRSIHGRALKAGIADSPTCNNCHGEHLILSSKDPNARTSAARQAQETCGTCHSDSRITAKYGLADYVVDTYIDSYHGWAAMSNSADAATCVDCHTPHWVLPARDPASTIHADNVVETCKQCHEDASAEFARSYTHKTASIAANPIVGWVRDMYWILIAVVVGGMILHNLVILVYYLVEKRRAELQGRTFVRLDRSQLIQHMLLAITFIGLVITGFALRFPEAWWVGQLGRMGMTENVRSTVHRVLASGLLFVGVWHMMYVIATKRGRSDIVSMVPRWRDVTDFIGQMKFHLWRSNEEVYFGRYDYTQKAEYWALVWGTIVMALTGFVLWFPGKAVQLLPSWIVQVSQTVHYYEAWLATLAILVWHFFFTMFHPKEYPMSWTWITGRMSVDTARHHHPEWYQREVASAAHEQKETHPKAGDQGQEKS